MNQTLNMVEKRGTKHRIWPGIASSISESPGIPNGKILKTPNRNEFRPLFTKEAVYCRREVAESLSLLMEFDGIQKRKGARLGAQRPKVKEKAKEKERWFRTAPGNKRPVTGEYHQRLGVIRASDPKVGTGFGINPMLNQLTGAAALIPFDRPPL